MLRIAYFYAVLSQNKWPHLISHLGLQATFGATTFCLTAHYLKSASAKNCMCDTILTTSVHSVTLPIEICAVYLNGVYYLGITGI